MAAPDLVLARELFRARIDSLEHDTRRCFWPINEAGAPGPAFFPAVMYAFATLDYFSSFWAGWNQTKPSGGPNQTARMVDFVNKYLLYGRKESQIAVHFWRHKLMHTAEPRPLKDPNTSEAYQWSMGGPDAGHMRLIEVTPKTFQLHFSPAAFVRDLREGVFGPSGFFDDLRTDATLQANYEQCWKELETYELKVIP